MSFAQGCTSAAGPPLVGLGTANSYAVLAGSAVTNTGPSLINGDVGLSPGNSITGFPPGIINGTQHSADAEAGQAKTDLVTAYNDAAGRTPATAAGPELGGTTLLAGVYSGATLGITGTVTLDAQHDPEAVFIIKSDSTLITASNSVVDLINGADPCNVFRQVSSSATLGTGTKFRGTILALSPPAPPAVCSGQSMLSASEAGIADTPTAVCRGGAASGGPTVQPSVCVRSSPWRNPFLGSAMLALPEPRWR